MALSIRSTNVSVAHRENLDRPLTSSLYYRYEERSLGVFEEPESEDDEPEEADFKGLSGRERVNRYLGWHLRRQASVGQWFSE